MTYKIVGQTTDKFCGSHEDTESGRDLVKAGKRVAETDFERMRTSIVGWWADENRNGTPHVIELVDTLDDDVTFDMLADVFSGAIRRATGETPDLRSMGGRPTVYGVKYRGTPGDLQQEIRRNLDGVEGFSKLQVKTTRERFLVFSIGN